MCVVLVAHNFSELDPGRADFGHLAFGDLFRFVYCLLQKVKRSSEPPVIEKWEAYMLPNHPCFEAIAQEHFLEMTRLLSSLEKKDSSFLRKEFHRDCRRFLEVGQGLSCFCPEIIIGGDDYSAFHFLDGLFALGWVRWSEIEHARAKFHSLVHEQRQLELGGNRSRVLINNVFAFSTSLASVLGGICSKLVIWCLKINSMFS